MGIVVGAAVVRDGRVLAARRTHPPRLAGRWELPGGAVENGEDEAGALARECREELDLEVVVGPQIGGEVPLPDGRVLRVRMCRAAGDPVASEHDALRWVGPDELDTLDWLAADRVVLPALAAALRREDLRPHGPSSAPSGDPCR